MGVAYHLRGLRKFVLFLHFRSLGQVSLKFITDDFALVRQFFFLASLIKEQTFVFLLLSALPPFKIHGVQAADVLLRKLVLLFTDIRDPL